MLSVSGNTCKQAAVVMMVQLHVKQYALQAVRPSVAGVNAWKLALLLAKLICVVAKTLKWIRFKCHCVFGRGGFMWL